MPGAVSVWIGQDSRELLAYEVAAESFRRWSRSKSPPFPVVPVNPIALLDVVAGGLYWRKHEIRPPAVEGGRDVLWDTISQAPMATEFSITRFLTPVLAKLEGQPGGWAVFTDCDVLVRRDLTELLDMLDPQYAVQCVKHEHVPSEDVKMRGELQTRYARKNWSSVVAYNLDHEANAELTVDLINAATGRELHAFCWLTDDQIGELPATWNYLVGTTELDDPANRAGLVHFTDGLPNMPGYERTGHPLPFAAEWWEYANAIEAARRESQSHLRPDAADQPGTG